VSVCLDEFVCVRPSACMTFLTVSPRLLLSIVTSTVPCLLNVVSCVIKCRPGILLIDRFVKNSCVQDYGIFWFIFRSALSYLFPSALSRVIDSCCSCRLISIKVQILTPAKITSINVQILTPSNGTIESSMTSMMVFGWEFYCLYVFSTAL
jgi:hypothetical protein